MDINKKTVLLIEDEEHIRIVYAEVLRDAGFKVIEAADGNSGLRRGLADEWDVMLLDIMLPGEDGLQILKSVKENIRLKYKPVIMLTNLGNEAIVNEAFKTLADGYLIKSQITPDRIVQEISQFIK
ncbi:response regulator [candidate division WWE3 bacterium]|nr:response regulator [candidate division WWE3 bacterium]